MKSPLNFIVKIDSTTNDKMKTDSGLELYIDTKFNEFDHRTTEGEVLAVPEKMDTPVEVGDTLYFHHHVVLNGGMPISELDKWYMVIYNPYSAAHNQAIAYKSKKTGEVNAIKGWCLLEPDQEDREGPVESEIEVVKLKETPVTTGVVSFPSKELHDLGVSDGDVVGFKKNRDYRIKIEGKEYYRVAITELLYRL
jgi:co-chaperonin GroES (HSP10)|tara:strand:+ start:294 stop:878 length:585 start_codon:yes stop_codon:yes gene_type:complete